MFTTQTYQSTGKRLLDIAVSVSALIVLAVPLLVVATLIKLTSKGPVLFTQKRMGYNCEPFLIYKFRSLRTDMCFDGYQANSSADAKTPIGNFLRTYSIDELPQLLNVLLGSMSIVGPRPHPLYLDQKYGDPAQLQQRYKSVPGITGLAQITGHRGETNTSEEFAARVEADLEYNKHITLFGDIKIILLTAIGVFGSSKGS